VSWVVVSASGEWRGGGEGRRGRGGEIVGECVYHLLCHRRMLRWLYRESCWSVGVQLRLNAIARMEGGPIRQGGLGVEWWGEGGVQPVGTSISCLMLHGSSFVGNRSDQCGLRVYPEKGDGGFQP